MRVLLPVIAAVLLSSCSVFKPGCLIHNKTVEVTTNVIVAKLQCNNRGAVEASMKSLVGELGLCKSQTGPIADTFCPLIANTVVSFTDKVIPDAWECTAKDAKAFLATALTDACRQIPVEK